MLSVCTLYLQVLRTNILKLKMHGEILSKNKFTDFVLSKFLQLIEN